MHGHRDTRLAVALAACALASPRIVRAEMPIALRVQASMPRVASDSVEEARRQMDLGRKAFAAKDFDRAVQIFSRVTTLSPLDADGFLWLGNAYIQQAFLAPWYQKPMLGVKARDAWEHAAALDPKNVEARENLSSWYETAPGLMGGSRDKAVAVAREIVAIDRYKGRMLLGGLAERTPDLAQAEIEYGDAARISPDSGRAFEAWVAMLEGQKKYAEAFRAADARVARLSDDIYGWYHIGRVAGLSGQRIDDGIAAMRRSMQFPLPKTFRYGPGGRHYWLGVLMEHKGSLNEAAAQLDSSLKLNPKDQQAMDALERVNARRKPPD